MLSLETVKQIKQVDVSKNAEKTKVRVNEAFSSASKEDKALIVAQTGQNKNSVYRAWKTGSASARIILALAEVLNISPYYLDGSSDEKGECGENGAKEYLLSLGYKKLVDADAPKKAARGKGKGKSKAKGTRAAKGVKTSKKIRVADPNAAAQEHQDKAEVVETNKVIEDVQSTIFRVTINESDKMRAAAGNLDLQSATQLLEALFIRAKAGGNAERLCEVVKHCLLS